VSESEEILPNKQFNAYLLIEPTALPGLYWVGACVDPDEAEYDTYNNCYTGAQVEVSEFQFSK
jgi:hypothetical protein